MKKRRRQLQLPLPKAKAADRKAWIHDRLLGYELRQAAREAKRREAARRRKVRQTSPEEPHRPPEQLSISSETFGGAPGHGGRPNWDQVRAEKPPVQPPREAPARDPRQLPLIDF